MPALSLYSVGAVTPRAATLELKPAQFSRALAAGRERRRSDRNRELAKLRLYDRILAVRQANPEANPNCVRPDKLLRH